MSTHFSVFDDDNGDIREGTLRPRTPDNFAPLGQQNAASLPFYRDPARETAELERRADELFRQADPQLFQAREVLVRAMRTAAHWTGRVNDLSRIVSLKANQMTGTSPDAGVGTRAERSVELHALCQELANAREEAAASEEELEHAKQRVQELTP
jgi:hypothetical protein